MSDDQSLSRRASEPVLVRVWDFPVRMVHWLIVLLVGLLWITARGEWFGSHRFSGCVVLALVIFRIYWGFCGSSPARFAHFLRGPKAVGRYLRSAYGRDPRPTWLGHNPLGGWNVIALLSALLLQGSLGLFAVDVDGLKSGPLASYVSFSTGRQAATLHQSMFNVLLLLIGLHIAAVLAHLLYRRENLIAPMLTGIKRVPRAQALTLKSAVPWRALVGLAASILLILLLAVGL